VRAGTHRPGQAIYGTIYGTVTDISGAAIPNATITVTDESKGTSVRSRPINRASTPCRILFRTSTTSRRPPPVSERWRTWNVQVSADTSPKVDLKLNVGNASESVTVTTEAPQLQTDRADVGTVFNEKTISGLPIAGAQLCQPATVDSGSPGDGMDAEQRRGRAGQPDRQHPGAVLLGVGYLLDGASNQDPILGQIVINPPLDAIGEAKISTQSYDAEFGQSVAAVVNAQTKSGTNTFHGDAFDYRRSGAQLARNPYNQFAPYSATSTRLTPPALYNQFGGSVGGPILKNKLFFFGDYQGVRQRNGASAQETVPTALAHNSCLSGNGCDLSEFLTGRGAAAGPNLQPAGFCRRH
jgi:hypothetical protein